jgi:hypothetical protein
MIAIYCGYQLLSAFAIARWERLAHWLRRDAPALELLAGRDRPAGDDLLQPHGDKRHLRGARPANLVPPDFDTS